MNTRVQYLGISVLALGMALAALVGCSNHEQATDGHAQHEGHAKHEGHGGEKSKAVLMIRTEPADLKPEQPARLQLMIHDASGAMVKDFEIVHEKKLHLIIVRDGLDQFAHIHPQVDDAGNITGAFTFPTAGKYRLYADHKPAGKPQAVAIGEVNVAGTPPPSAELVPNAPGRVTADDLAAEIAIDKANAAGTSRISFTLFDASGKAVADLQPYLGAMGHLVVLSADGTEYVHSHPVEEGSTGGAVVFEVHFPHPGLYKGWGQFRRSDAVHDVPFVIRVE